MIGNRRYEQKWSFPSGGNLPLYLSGNCAAQYICKCSRKQWIIRLLNLLVMFNYSRYVITEIFKQKSHYIDTVHNENEIPCQ